MARANARLTAKAVEAARHSGTTKGTQLVPDGQVPGLYLQLAPSGAKSFILRFMLAGKAREMGLEAVMDLGSGELPV